jgi:ABC-type branched-subunit amino acid transport system permease subunit
VATLYRRGHPRDWNLVESLLLYILLGVGAGGVYAILALGVTVIFKGSGVVNFAQAAIAMFAGFCYIDLRGPAGEGMSIPLAMAITIAGAAVFGVAFSYLVQKPMREAPDLARVVTTLGLFTAISGLVVILWPSTSVATVNVTPVLPSDPARILGGVIAEDRFWIAGIAVLLSALLWAVYKFTRFGVATRAVAENERGAALAGFSPDIIAAGNWALGCALAALGGILVLPVTGLDPTVAMLIVPVLAAALAGGFTSFGIITATAFGIGALQSLAGNYMSHQPGVQFGVPFLVVIFLMVARGRVIPERGTVVTGRMPLSPRTRIRLSTGLIFSGVVLVLLFTLDSAYQSAIAYSMIFGVIAISLVVVTGFVGQISLAQVTLAGVGALTAAHVSDRADMPFPLPIIVGAVVAVPIGVILGLPALRVRGISLAIVTLGAAVTGSAMVFGNPQWAGGFAGLPVPKPSIAGVSLDPVVEPQAFGIFTLVVLLICMALVLNVRRSATGRRMLAVRGNERAAAALGIDVSFTKLQAFGASAFFAGLGGGLLVYKMGTFSNTLFEPIESIQLLTLVFIAGIAATSGGVLAGAIASGGLVVAVFHSLGVVGSWWTFIAGIIVILNAVFQPNGIVVVAMDAVKRLRTLPSRRFPAQPNEVTTGGPSSRVAGLGSGTTNRRDTVMEAVDR